MQISGGWAIALAIPGFIGCGLGIFNSIATIGEAEVQMQGISIQIATLSVLVVVCVFLLSAVVLTRMDSIREETLHAAHTEFQRQRDQQDQQESRVLDHWLVRALNQASRDDP